jgi:DNA-binding SARP family transcriptional activator
VDGSATQGQPFALLAILAWAGGRGMARDKIVSLLWPESPASRASHRLSQLAHHARRGLGSADLIAGAGELRLDERVVSCDLWDFHEARRSGMLERAAELYGGPFLDGFYLSDNAEFERWVEARRSELAREYQETLEALAIQCEIGGDAQAAARWWHRLAEHEPLSSRVTMHLMTALAAAGDRARALEHARRYQTQVKDELDAEPNPAVLVLAAQLRQPRQSVAVGVVPLDAPDENENSRTLAWGLTEELMTAAAAIPGVRVASRTSVNALQRAVHDVREIGARLGLDAVLEGSVREAAGRIRLTVRLVDVGDGCQRWSGSYEADAVEGFDAQEALARKVAEGMRGALTEIRGR